MAYGICDENKNFVTGAEAIKGLYISAPDKPETMTNLYSVVGTFYKSIVGMMLDTLSSYLFNTEISTDQLRVYLSSLLSSYKQQFTDRGQRFLTLSENMKDYY